MQSVIRTIEENLNISALNRSLPIDAIPADLKSFFECFDGVTITSRSGFEMTIPCYENFTHSNTLILQEEIDEPPTNRWFVIGIAPHSQWVIIDLNQNRFGYCYDGFWDSYGLVGEMKVIAHSFTEFVENFISDASNNYYWIDDSFEYRGDAFDPDL